MLPGPAAPAGKPPSPDRFLLSVNGRPRACTDPHGAGMTWIEH